MGKIFEFGVARVQFDSPLNKVNSMIAKIDVMSAKGWELKGYFDAVSEIVIFFQREKESDTPIPNPPPVQPDPVVNLKLDQHQTPTPLQSRVRSIRSGSRVARRK